MSFSKFSDAKDATAELREKAGDLEDFMEELAELVDSAITIRDASIPLYNPETGAKGVWIPQDDWARFPPIVARVE